MPDREPIPPTDLPLRRKIAFASVAVVLVLLLVEGGLRLLDVQPPTDASDPFVGFAGSSRLFEPVSQDDGSSMMVTASSKRALFNPQAFPVAKADDVTRIFCLGGSTTYGRPYSDPTSFVGWLRELLPVADPTRRYEVINAGGISYASYRVARIVEEIVEYEPDVLIVYTGHNEFLEERTYAEVRDRSPLLRGALSVLHGTRTGSLIASAVAGDRGPVDGRTVLSDEVQARLDHSAGLDLYRRDDALAAGVLRHYDRALRNIVGMARTRGIEIVLVTPASNLADFSPFKSAATEGLDPADARAAEAARLAADAALDSENPAEAVRAAREAVRLDPRNPASHWSHARALEVAGESGAAARAYTRARDEDVCALRAPGAFIEAVQSVGRELAVPTVDYVGRLEREAIARDGHPLVGDQLFLDHVHPTIEGHRILALALIEELDGMGVIARAATFGREAIDPVVTRVEGGVTEEDHARALANLALTLSWAGKGEQSRQLAERAIATGVEDGTILLMAARHATLAGDHDEAFGYYQRAVSVSPNDATVRSQMGFFLAGVGRTEAAVAQFYLASLMWSKNERYQMQFASSLESVGLHELALGVYEHAQTLAPDDASIASTVQRLRKIADSSRRYEDLRPQVERHENGAIASMVTTRTLADGVRVPDGIRLDWHPGGELARFARVRDGRDTAPIVRWSVDGREVERVER